MKTKLLLYSALLLLTQCSKCKHNDPQPEPPATLPAETQTGAGTFGCLINGKVYTAPSTILTTGDWQSLTKLVVGGQLHENGNRRTEGVPVSMALNGQLLNQQAFSMISSATPFPIFTPGVNQFYARTVILPCIYDGARFKTGRVELVKFDGVQRIASGRFAFALYEPGGCDTLRVTNGRFDVKF